MSSLLDILNRTDRSSEQETAPPEPLTGNGPEPVELHLAVDNGPLGDPAAEPAFEAEPGNDPAAARPHDFAAYAEAAAPRGNGGSP